MLSTIYLEKFPSAKIKLDQFFIEWLILEGDLVLDELLDEIAAEKLIDVNISVPAKSVNNVQPSATALAAQSSSVSNSFSRSPKKRTQSEMLHKDDETSSNFTASALPATKNAATSIDDSSTDLILPTDNHISAAVTSSTNANTTALATHSFLNLSIADFKADSKKNDDDLLASSLTTTTSSKISSSRRRSNFDSIPKFYFPGKQKLAHILPEDQLSRVLPEIEAYFKPFPDGIPAEKFVGITKKLCGIPSFFNLPFCKLIHELYSNSGGTSGSASGIKSVPPPHAVRGNSGIFIKLKDFKAYWKSEIEPYTRVERFFRVIKQPHVDYISKDDFVPFLKELLHFHPGLDFLATHDEFKRKYALTVITRIFYKVNLSRTGKISLRELKASNLFQEFVHVDEETDINKVTEYFSYEHFYVLYCRFFELDQDRDGKLKQEDLARYGDYCLSEAIVERVFRVGMRAFSDGIDAGYNRGFSGGANMSTLHFGGSTTSSPRDASKMIVADDGSTAMSPSATLTGAALAEALAAEGGMTFPDFVYFMLAEEDKSTLPAIRFWFNCCDMDGDGRLTYDDMWHFYRAQLDRVATMGQDVASFRDVLCQMLDYLHPVNPLSITIEDMTRPDKRISSGLIFDVLFNMHKFMRFEMRDPFQEKLKREDGFGTDWNRFAYFEYIKLASEEEAAAESSVYMNGGDEGVDIDDGVDNNNDGNVLDTDHHGDDDGEDGDVHNNISSSANRMDVDSESASKEYHSNNSSSSSGNNNINVLSESKQQQQQFSMYYDDDDLESDDSGGSIGSLLNSTTGSGSGDEHKMMGSSSSRIGSSSSSSSDEKSSSVMNLEKRFFRGGKDDSDDDSDDDVSSASAILTGGNISSLSSATTNTIVDLGATVRLQRTRDSK